MIEIKVLLVNYADGSLIRELLRKGYAITTVNTKGKLFNSITDKFDLIYFAKFTPPRLDDIHILLHKANIPIVYGFHSSSIIFKPYRATNYVDNIISVAKLAQMKIGRSVNALHVLNADEFKLLRFLGLNCHHVPLGVDTNLFRPGNKNSRFTIVFVSARYQKGTAMLINIVPAVLKKAPDVKFIMTDIGFLSNYFYSLKKAYRNNVEVCERLPQNEFARLFSSSHVLLFPSRFESFGLVVLEALSSGMPVVCYDIAGAPRDIVKRFGVGVVAKPFNIDEIVNGILEYHKKWKEDVREFAHLSNMCRRIARRYSWSIIADLFDNMFNQVLEQRR